MRFITPILGLAVMATVASPLDSVAIRARSIVDGASILAIRSFEHHAGLAPRSVPHGALQTRALSQGSNLRQYEKRSVLRAWITTVRPFANPAKKQAAANLIEAHRLAKSAKMDAKKNTKLEIKANQAIKETKNPEDLEPTYALYDLAYKRTGASYDRQVAAEMEAKAAAERYRAIGKGKPVQQLPPLLEAPP